MRHAVILAGGSGTRLWPASRKSLPKQFLPLSGKDGESLIAGVHRRAQRIADNTCVVTLDSQVGAVRTALPNLPEGNVIAEPAGRNTAAAIGLAAARLHQRDPDAVLGVFPADQTCADDDAFENTMKTAFETAQRSGAIVTVGIVPNKPHTGFGYIELGDGSRDGGRVVSRFVEKPDLPTAETYVASGRYMWNAGMFFATAKHLLAELAAHLPETHAKLVEMVGASDAAIARDYPRLPSISFDYAVMEKTQDVLCVPGDFGWNDVGSWSALAEYGAKDDSGNAFVGTVHALDSKNNVLYSDGSLVAAIDVENLVIVKSGDAVLVAPRDRVERVRDLVKSLGDAGLDAFL